MKFKIFKNKRTSHLEILINNTDSWLYGDRTTSNEKINVSLSLTYKIAPMMQACIKGIIVSEDQFQDKLLQKQYRFYCTLFCHALSQFCE